MERKKEKIHILHVVGRMDCGGTETLLMNLLRTIKRDEFHFDFVEQTNDKCFYDEELLSLGSVIYRCPHISPVSLNSYRKWWKDFYDNHPEYKIIHGHSSGSAPIYLDEANKAKRITIMHSHSNSFGVGIAGQMRRAWQLPLRHIANYNIACSINAGISQFGKKGKFNIINNGIRVENFIFDSQIRNKVREQFDINDDQFLVGNVARFDTEKNHLFLIDIFYEILKLRPNSILMLVGQGPLENKIRTKIADYGIQEHVTLTGVRKDVNELYQAMDAFILPSLFEGLGIVNVEAQVSGLPCFVSDKVIPEEVNLTEVMHYISLDESPEIWAKTIVENSPVAHRVDQSQTIIDHGFDIQSTADWLCDFYRKIYYD